MHRNVGKLEMHDSFEEVRGRRLLVGPESTCNQITLTLPIRGVVTQKGRLQQGAAAPMLFVPPDNVIRPADLDADNVGSGRVW